MRAVDRTPATPALEGQALGGPAPPCPLVSLARPLCHACQNEGCGGWSPQLCLRSPLQMTLRATNALSTYRPAHDCFSLSETGPQKSLNNLVSLTLLDMLLEADGVQPALCGPFSLGCPEHAGRR